MTITPEFLKDVQRSGWIIDYVVDGLAVGQCPRAGCGVRVNLRPGAAIPQACPTSDTLADVLMVDWGALLAFLVDRREALALSQLDLDDCIGLSPDHIAKMESLARLPSVPTMFHWVSSLGYEVVLRPAGLPPKTLAVIARTRAKAAMKRNRYRQKRQDRLTGARSG